MTPLDETTNNQRIAADRLPIVMEMEAVLETYLGALGDL